MNINELIAASVKSGLKFKLTSILSGILILPIFYKALGPSNFGYYALFLSISTWINNLDFGLANASRKRLTQAHDSGVSSELFSEISKVLVSTFILSISLCILALYSYFFARNYIAETFFGGNIYIFKCFFTACLIMIINFIGAQHRTFNLACHNTKAIYSSSFYAQLSGILISILLFRLSLGSIGNILITISLSIAIVNLIYLFVFLINKKYLKGVVFNFPKYDKEFIVTGVSFFTVQVLTLGVNNLDALAITKYLGSLELAHYTVLQKIYFLLATIFTIFILPFWSIFTTAVRKNDRLAFLQAESYLNIAIGLLAIALTLLTISVDKICSIWLGSNFVSPAGLRICLAGLILIKCIIDAKVYFLNSIEKVFGQALVLFFCFLTNLILVSKLYIIGSSGIIFSMIIALIPMLIYSSYTYHSEKRKFLSNSQHH